MTAMSTGEGRESVHRLDPLLRPERLVMVGASDNNHFSRRAFAQLERLAGDRRVPLVNPNTPLVHGRRTVRSCLDVDGGVDCAFLVTSQSRTGAALADAAQAGARAAVVLSAGWAEQGADGRRAQAALVDQAREAGIVLLGPNHLGFANLWDGVAACALGLDLPTAPGSVALVSQSGAVGSSLVGYASRHDIRFSFVVTTGNEAMVDIADVVDYLVDDDNTRAIAVYAETIRRPHAFLAAVGRAASANKAVVILKSGASEIAARTAAAHTGALVGNDRVITAALRQAGVIRVEASEDLLTTAALCAAVGPTRAPGVGILAISGGACGVIADRGHAMGVSFPELSASAVTALTAALPDFANPQNPVDVTGGAVNQESVWSDGIRIFSQEPAIGLVGVITSLPRDGEPQRSDVFRAVGRASSETGLPAVIFPQVDQEQSEAVRQLREECGVPLVASGLDRFVTAAAGLARWSTWAARKVEPETPAKPFAQTTLPDRSGQGGLSEWDARAVLESAGIPLVPATLVHSARDAVEAATALGGTCVLKMCSAAVAHKTELGGVVLGLTNADEITAAYDALTARAQAAGVELDGVLVSPQRDEGLELLVGVNRDESWGDVLVVAMGGALVEVLDDSVLRLLPVTAGDVREMLGELRSRALLEGYRGSAPVDIDELVDVILRIARVAQALSEEVEAVEVNPLLVASGRIEALDALVTLRAPNIDAVRTPQEVQQR